MAHEKRYNRKAFISGTKVREESICRRSICIKSSDPEFKTGAGLRKEVTVHMAQNPVFTITMNDGREMKGELYPEIAPQSVGNFAALANSGFYDGLTFHRVIPGFMIQGGDPKGIGIGGPGYCIKGEFAANGVNNPLKHTYGVLSMARSMMPDSAGSQFFIMTSDSPHLDGQYAAFGKVLEGMEVAEDIVKTKRDASDKPLEPQVMASIRVDTFGQCYPFDQI